MQIIKINQLLSRAEDGRFLYRQGRRDYRLTEAQALAFCRHSESCLVATAFWGSACVLVAAIYAAVTSTTAGQAFAGPAASIALASVVLATAILGIYVLRQEMKWRAFLGSCNSVALPRAEARPERWRQWAVYLDGQPSLRRFPTWSLILVCGLTAALSLQAFLDVIAPAAPGTALGPLADRVVDGFGFVLSAAALGVSASLLLARVSLRRSRT